MQVFERLWGHKPTGVSGWRATATVVLLALVPQVAVQQLVPELRSVSGAALASSLVVYPVIAVAAALLYVHWRITGSQGTAWLAVGLAVLAVNGLAFALIRVASLPVVADRPGWMLIGDVTLAVGLLALILAAERVTITVDPMVAGVAGGLLVTQVDILLALNGPPLHPDGLSLTAGKVVLVALGAGIAWAVTRLSTVPGWVRGRLALAVLALAVSAATSGRDGTGSDALHVVSFGAGLLGAVLVCDTAVALVRQAIRKEHRELRRLHHRLADLETGWRADREKLHEIESTMAGVACASRLIRRADTLHVEDRERLEAMLEAETARLERLVRREDPAVTGHPPDDLVPRPRTDEAAAVEVREASVDLDQTIEAVVTAHRARGRTVRWQPCGQVVAGRRDDITQVLNILLDNAAKHAPSATSEIGISPRQDTIEIVVSDDGPGVSPDVSRTLFHWGEKGPGSAGQGIGLSTAYRLMHEAGNYLRLVESPAPGATFVVGLRTAGGGPCRSRAPSVVTSGS